MASGFTSSGTPASRLAASTASGGDFSGNDSTADMDQNSLCSHDCPRINRKRRGKERGGALAQHAAHVMEIGAGRLLCGSLH